MKSVIDYRRELHRIAELSFEEIKTSEYLRLQLSQQGLEFQTCAQTGLIVTLGKNLPEKAVMFRADMDGLPIQEQNDFDYASVHAGRMHACGHDAHMAILLQVLFKTQKQESQLKRPVKFIFQPAEERGGGACVMLENGVLQHPEVGEAFGLHIANRFKNNFVALREGISSSYCDEFSLLIQGQGGHAARPHQCIEPLMIGSRLALDCQQIIARNVSAMDSAVLTFTKMHSGSNHNVIADTCEMGGTLRTRDLAVRSKIREALDKKFKALEVETGAKIEISFEEGYPAIQNSSKSVQVVREVVRESLGEEFLVEGDMGLGGEDFAYFLEQIPGCYFLLGCDGDKMDFAPHHNARFDFDESVLQTGVDLFLKLIEKRAM
jgi:amidohydrolase